MFLLSCLKPDEFRWFFHKSLRNAARVLEES